ncbi:isochorismatase [Paractinoplanes deccanensis]|uniref:Isochorismatase n=1 Tax=Paractinoplanes deccanensis TaxID=113561 RepID=A0ABQ3YC44_9ACTN|nr:isochorismatase family protein [Actinoplanes deccanensis]GID77500.1 isochorismatase [Actinoplanes deccanensis]
MSTLGRQGRDGVLVIDMQVGVLRDCQDRDAVLGRTAVLVERARAAGKPVIWIQHEGAGLDRDSDAWRLAEPLSPAEGEPVVAKTFRDAFAATALEQTLARLGVDHLIVAGAQSDFCVRATTQRAAAEGYDVTLVADCHTTEDAEHDGVRIGAAQIVAHNNLWLSTLRYPGQSFATVKHDEVA